MPTKAHKNAAVDSLKKSLSDAQIAVVADTRGLSVAELTDLRRRVQKVGGDVTVAKNTLVKVATDGQDQWSGLESLLKGPTALVIGREDFIGAAKALNDFSKEKRKVQVQIRGGVLHGAPMDTAKVVQLASLPTREALLTMLAQMLAAPITGFARVVDAVAKQKGAGQEAPASEPVAQADAPEAAAPEAAAPEAATEAAPEASSDAAPEAGSDA